MIIDQKIIEEVFTNFSYFSENNLLHISVDRLVQEVVTRGSDEVLIHLMDGVAIQDKLVEMYEKGWPASYVNTFT